VWGPEASGLWRTKQRRIRGGERRCQKKVPLKMEARKRFPHGRVLEWSENSRRWDHGLKKRLFKIRKGLTKSEKYKTQRE